MDRFQGKLGIRRGVGPHPVLSSLLYEPGIEQDQAVALPWLLKIDAAHLVMLARSGILPAATVARLLSVHREISARLDKGLPAFEVPAGHRGLYFVYEQHSIERLGGEVGGAAHVARSRNDINAASTRLRLRTHLLAFLDHAAALLDAALGLGEAHAATLMSAFTHMQPAQPATLGHYLAGISAELLRSTERLDAFWEDVNRSPLGAAAGMGTTFPIDRELTASLLGFDAVVDNSLDAVASRDFVVHVLSALAMLGVTLTRLAADLQTWGSNAYGFLSWPDELVSTSSIMPQKRNAFVLENVRGLAVRPTGALAAVLATLKGTPFSNSVEVGTEAVSHLWPAVAGCESAVRLTELMLRGVEVDSERMRDFLARAATTMTALADHLVARHDLPFRSAHEAVARLLQRLSPEEREAPEAILPALREIVEEISGRALPLSREEISRALDPEACAWAAAYGGGPSPEVVREQLARLRGRLGHLAGRQAERRQRLAAADVRLRQAVDEFSGG
jgi:argininosuccinate lyase